VNLKDAKPSGRDERVVQFRPRKLKSVVAHRDKSGALDGGTDSSVRDFSKYQKSPGGSDYRHRMTMNIIVFAFSSTLVMAGVWIALRLTPHS
jgi:hypothetical protein